MSNYALLLRYLLFVLTALLLTACETAPVKLPPQTRLPPPKPDYDTPLQLGAPIRLRKAPDVQLYPTEFQHLSGWQRDNHAAAFVAFKRSCSKWQVLPASKPLSGVFDLGQIGDWQKLCDIPVRSGDERNFFERWFKPFAVEEAGRFDGLFTGYYAPELHGSFKKSARYRFPIYRVPRDLITHNGQIGRMAGGRFVPYYERAEIVGGALSGKGEELLWVDNDIDAFFMDIQGSGRVVMDDGRVLGLSYAGKNGHGYYPIGRTLVDRGEISREAISMQTIRQWIEQHPSEGRQLMLENRSYVFFRLTEAHPAEGVKGAMAVPLTAEHSLAVDREYFPLGIPLWLDAEHPAGNQRLRHLVMAQDTGGAIKGLIRGDLYWGQGHRAGEMAGPMKSRGRYFLLVPRHLAVG